MIVLANGSCVLLLIAVVFAIFCNLKALDRVELMLASMFCTRVLKLSKLLIILRTLEA